MRRHRKASRQSPQILAPGRVEGAGPIEGFQAAPGDTSPEAVVAEKPRDVVPDGEIAPLAHELWIGRGRPEGTDREDWFEAERRLREERGGRPSSTHALVAEQAREAGESWQARDAVPTNRDRMVAIGRGNQQAGRQNN
jgi:hypothetical protein